MELSPEGIIAYVISLIDTMPSAIMQGDVFALTITLIIFFIAVVVINQLTGLLIRFLKKAILFIIVTLAFWQFVIMFYGKVTTEGFTQDTIIFGVIGFILGFVAISTALFVALRSYYESQEGTSLFPFKTSSDAAGEEPGSKPSLMPSQPTSPLQSQDGLTAMSATPAPEPAPSDNSMGATLTAMRDSLSVST